MSIEDVLKRSEIFLGLSDAELKTIACLPSTRMVSLQTGQFLFKEGEEAKNIFIIDEGQIRVVTEVAVPPENKPVQLTIDLVSKGTLLGWSALVRPHLYVLSAVCQQPCRLVIIAGSELLSLFEQNCLLGYRVLQGLSQIISTRYRDLQHIMITGKRWPFIERLSYT